MENNQNFLSKNIEKLVSLNVSFHKNYEKNQVSLFDNFFDDKDFDSSNFDECSYNEKLSMEYDSFGFYLSEHPSKFYKSLSYENDLYVILLNLMSMKQIICMRINFLNVFV